MTDNRDDAEFLDGDALGEEVGDEGLPGTEGFPPDRPWGVEDSTREVSDDMATRDLRRSVGSHGNGDRFALVAEGSTEGLMNDEAQEIAAAVDVAEGDLSPEEGALHIVDSPDQ
ncbi:MAG: hypothetical protein ACXV3B_00160 [Ilumatobacteraceae bacterium]